MPRPTFYLLFIILCITNIQAQPLPDYYTRSQFLFAPSAGFSGGLVGFSNPANLAHLSELEFKFYWNSRNDKLFSMKDWGAFTGTSHLGLAVQRQKANGIGVTDFKLSTAMGTPALAVGLGYGWSAGKQKASGREKQITLGVIFRPAPYLSAGLVGNQSVESNQRELVAELGLRPLGNSRLTLFADAALQKGTRFKDAHWSVGGRVQIVNGVNLLARYFDTKRFSVGVALSFGKNAIGSQSFFNDNSDYIGSTHFTRFGAAQKSFFSKHIARAKYYVPLTLHGSVSYLKFKYLDEGPRLFDILKNIRAAAEDPKIHAIALNLSGLQIRPEHAWEIRQELVYVKKSGKQVVIFLDRVGMTGYHLASVADEIVCDPQGGVWLPGYALGRTYLKGTLEKLGLGFDEWRFFKYKSALESLSRENMSDADREQLQAYLDDWYELTRSEICQARSISHEQFDQLVDEQVYFMAAEALATGLVDTLARWSEIDEIISQVTGKRPRRLSAEQLLANAVKSDTWGSRNKIAIVYALGVCAMDSGIRARWLQQVFQGLVQNSAVKAVVFRVDSPGGDGMASDVVAEALKKCRAVKPVIISHGQVAASGGYWISTYGSKIVAAPNTVTGSIGVIGGWIFDTGIGSKLGMVSDIVTRGAHADLGRGIRIPYTPLEIPARNLTPYERQKVETNIRKYYEQFVKIVATGRNLTESQVHEIAQGHIYSGLDGKENKLVDEIGGLYKAIALARKEAGIHPKEEIELVEIPTNKGWFNLRKQLFPVGLLAEKDPDTELLEFLMQLHGQPAPVLVPGLYPGFDK